MTLSLYCCASTAACVFFEREAEGMMYDNQNHVARLCIPQMTLTMTEPAGPPPIIATSIS